MTSPAMRATMTHSLKSFMLIPKSVKNLEFGPRQSPGIQ